MGLRLWRPEVAGPKGPAAPDCRRRVGFDSMGLVISRPLPTAQTTPDVFAQLWLAHFCRDSQLLSPTGQNIGKAKPWLAETGSEGSSRFRRETSGLT